MLRPELSTIMLHFFIMSLRYGSTIFVSGLLLRGFHLNDEEITERGFPLKGTAAKTSFELSTTRRYLVNDFVLPLWETSSKLGSSCRPNHFSAADPVIYQWTTQQGAGASASQPPNVNTPAAQLEKVYFGTQIEAPQIQTQQAEYNLQGYQRIAIRAWLHYYFEPSNRDFIGLRTFWKKLDAGLTQNPFNIGAARVFSVMQKTFLDVVYNVVAASTGNKVTGFKLRKLDIARKQPPTNDFLCNLFIYWAFTNHFLGNKNRYTVFSEPQSLVNEFLGLFSRAGGFAEGADKDKMLAALAGQPFAKSAMKGRREVI